MIIKSLIKRDGGSAINIDGVIYDFQPDADGDHVCDVSDSSHANLLLSITEGFAKKAEAKATKAK
jgi:hypothetical protein